MPSEGTLSLQFGDVVLVRFPFTNQTAFKQRPAVIVSNSKYNLARPDVVLMAVTSQLGSALSPGDTAVEHWRAAGLLKPSAVKPLFATIEQSMIARQLGALEQPDISALRNAIANIIG
jgi:mRNA interferase MazF